jgi:hypothetical protein
MKELLDKISSYNIFNYLLPGVIFSILVTKFCNIDLIFNDILVGAFNYYFIGLIVSRFGSLVIEPILKKIHFVKFADYTDFIKASKEDEKIEILSETNNMFRTFISVFTLLFLVKGFQVSATNWQFLKENELTILLTFLLCLFLFSYRKQTNFIIKRIKSKK